MKIQNINSTIRLKNRADLRNQPFDRVKALSNKLGIILHNGGAIVDGIKINRSAFIKLEFFLGLIGFDPTRKIAHRTTSNILRLFVGFCYHPTVFGTRIMTQYQTARRVWTYFLSQGLVSEFPVKFPSVELSPEITELVEEAGQLEIDKKVLIRWEGWASTNLTGQVSYFPLGELFNECGQPFTDRFFSIYDSYFRGRHTNCICATSSMVRVIVELWDERFEEKIQNSSFSRKFFERVLKDYLVTGYRDGEGASYASLVNEWRNKFCFFASNFLIGEGLIGHPEKGLPMPKGGSKPSHLHNIRQRKDGVEVKNNLLTQIPLESSDSQALEILLHNISQDIQYVEQWAKYMMDDIRTRVEQRKILAIRGVAVSLCGQPQEHRQSPKTWLRSFENPKYLENAAATFEKHGYLTSRDVRVSKLYPNCLNHIARSLGLSTQGVLLPFAVMLVIKHPEITQSFLENFILYDKNGICTGLLSGNDTEYIISQKRRKGSEIAEQKVLLTKETRDAVRIVLDITQTQRNYLREKGDPNWRYMFLSSGKGFAYPKPWRLKSDNTGSVCQERLLNEFIMAGVPEKEAQKLAPRISLAKIRASRGVEIYLEKKSATEMASALGHNSYSPRLLNHYLPKPIQDFFRDRWIRIFQTAIIVDVLEESEYQLQASGFKSLGELHEFLNNNSINFGPLKGPSNPLPPTNNSKVVIRVNEEILVTLIHLKKTVDAATSLVSGKARYWSEISEKILAYIESDSCLRPDLKDMLDLAKGQRIEIDWTGFIYEQPSTGL